MPFRMPKKCRKYFEPLTGRNKLEMLFDGYYLSALVGLANAQIDNQPDLESSEFLDEYPSSYRESCDYIAALLIATEAKRIPVNIENADDLEQLMTQLVDSHSKTRLSLDGENRLNQYASRGIDIIIETMMPHTSLEEFYQEFYEHFSAKRFE